MSVGIFNSEDQSLVKLASNSITAEETIETLNDVKVSVATDKASVAADKATVSADKADIVSMKSEIANTKTYINETAQTISENADSVKQEKIAIDETKTDIDKKYTEISNTATKLNTEYNNLTSNYYTKEATNSLINSTTKPKYSVVNELPTSDISTDIIYLKSTSTTSTDGIYEMYTYQDSNWVKIGTSNPDLADYYTKELADSIFATKTEINNTNTEVSELKEDIVDINELLEHEVIKPYLQNGSATISTSWGYVHVVDNIELPTAKMYRFTFTIPSETTNVIYCRARKGTTTFLQLQIAPGKTSISIDKYCEPLDIEYLDTTGDINAVGLTVSATIEEIGGETIEKSIIDKVEMNPLYGKTVLFNGDSICASATDTEHNLAWAGRIMNHNSMNGKNYAVMGGTISSNNYRNDSSAYHWISASVDTMYSENPNADYIIFEGGTNDADLLGSIINGNTSERLGTFSLDDFSGNYDMNTFCGAFENLCYKATNYWTGRKIGYVVAYKMAGQSGLSSGYTKEKSNRRAYFDIAMQICEKWGIPVLNLWDNCYMNPSNVACYDPSLSETENKATKMIYDGQHPATKGYEYIYPIIESWMQTL